LNSCAVIYVVPTGNTIFLIHSKKVYRELQGREKRFIFPCNNNATSCKVQLKIVLKSCSHLTQYWTQLKVVIDEVIETEIPVSFEIMYLGRTETRKDDYKLL